MILMLSILIFSLNGNVSLIVKQTIHLKILLILSLQYDKYIYQQNFATYLKKVNIQCLHSIIYSELIKVLKRNRNRLLSIRLLELKSEW